jgi:hypothetical protein
MNRQSWRALWPWLALLMLGLVATWLRYGLIESSAIGNRCSAISSPLWCSWRHWLVLGFLTNVYGILALITAALSMLSRRVAIAWLATALGLFALQLYCFESGALALLIGSLRLLRLLAPRTLPTDEHRAGNRQVETQP